MGYGLVDRGTEYVTIEVLSCAIRFNLQSVIYCSESLRQVEFSVIIEDAHARDGRLYCVLRPEFI